MTNSVRRDCLLFALRTVCCSSIMLQLRLRVCHFVGSYVLWAVPVPSCCSTCQNRAKNEKPFPAVHMSKISPYSNLHTSLLVHTYLVLVLITLTINSSHQSHHHINHWLYYLLNHRNISYIARRINKGFIYLKTLYLKYEFFPQSC